MEDLRAGSRPAAAKVQAMGVEAGLGQHHQKHGVVARGQGAPLALHDRQRLTRIERRGGDQRGAMHQRDEQ
ncbi:hypothetical protein D3C87_2172790 [compost metagenome]